MLAHKPAIAQLVEHLTVETCSNQMVPGLIPGGRIYAYLGHVVGDASSLHAFGMLSSYTQHEVLEAGLEPAISSLGGRRLIH